MARDPAFDPRNIVLRYLEPGERVDLIIDGCLLCADFRMRGPVFGPTLLGHSVVHAAQGGTWVPGVWALSNTKIYYVSRRSWFGWPGGQIFDVSIPIAALVGIERTPKMIGVGYEFLSLPHVFRFWAKRVDADRFIPLVMAAWRQVAA